LAEGKVDSFRELGRTLMILGGSLMLAGGFLFLRGRLPFRLGRLPGDIVYKSENTTLYFPIMTSIALSIGLSLLFWLIHRLRR
jgi:Protein of unknown function (DUF2905)